ncbi:hypothetical protein [Saccharomonospora piscinae]|uniref:hypothetical protein n=1 Tax=Saccharomonospora piscinae TaxID=687388 RepID=UPI001593736C|nr:hypothetical protein [Saccharomonospora piscinae]
MTHPDDQAEAVPPNLAAALSSGRWQHLMNAYPADLDDTNTAAAADSTDAD